jgi:hypothetical protein
VDGGDGNERAAKKPYGILHEASYAIDAPAGDRRVLAHNIAMHNEKLAQQAAALELTRTLRKSAAEQERLELARTLRARWTANKWYSTFHSSFEFARVEPRTMKQS